MNLHVRRSCILLLAALMLGPWSSGLYAELTDVIDAADADDPSISELM